MNIIKQTDIVRDSIEKEERKIKVNVFYGGEKLVDCMGRVIKKHTK